MSRCLPLPGNFGTAVHACMLWSSVGTLVLKNMRLEKRPWKVFILDCSKQLAGALWASALGEGAYECDAYLGSLLAWATAGVLLEYGALVALERILSEGTNKPTALRTGEYTGREGHFSCSSYVAQVIIWIACVTFALFLQATVSPPFVALASLLLWPFSWSGSLQVLVATVFAPCVLCPLQAWVTDDFLKCAGPTGLFWLAARRVAPAPLVAAVEGTPIPSEEPLLADEGGSCAVLPPVLPSAQEKKVPEPSAWDDISTRPLPADSSTASLASPAVCSPENSAQVDMLAGVLGMDRGGGVGAFLAPPSASVGDEGKATFMTLQQLQARRQHEQQQRGGDADGACNGGADGPVGPLRETPGSAQ